MGLVTFLQLALGVIALGAPSSAAKLYLCGDSTMSNYDSKNNQGGWGQFIGEFVDLPVVNRARGGRSARSFTREGMFQDVAKLVAPGDWVVIEFGHNDGGSVSPQNDNGRTPCPGSGKTTCAVNFQGEKTAKTFPTYLTEAGKLLVGKGAKVIMSSQTPNNVYETGSFVWSPSRFAALSQTAATEVGSQAFYVDHGKYTADAFKDYAGSHSGKSVTTQLFMPNDHTHTTRDGARLVAKAFARAVMCAKIPFAEHVKNVRC